jgi:hypothetical protein
MVELSVETSMNAAEICGWRAGGKYRIKIPKRLAGAAKLKLVKKEGA